MRAEGKKQGVPEKEIEMMLELAQALDSSDREVAEGSIFLAGRRDAFDRIYRVDILGSDGQPIATPQRSRKSAFGTDPGQRMMRIPPWREWKRSPGGPPITRPAPGRRPGTG